VLIILFGGLGLLRRGSSDRTNCIDRVRSKLH
jgi:hypothetical protein